MQTKTEIVIPTISDLLETSAATADFKKAVADLQSTNRSNQRVHFATGNPPVKVLRVLCGLLEHAPGLAIDRVSVDGASGCSDYRGEITVNDGEKKFRFVWDCAWKAEQAGFKDFFGGYDQIKAARTFGYRCFEEFREA